MNSILETIPQLSQYQTSLLILAILSLIVLIQNFLTAPFAFIKEEQVPGIPLRGDHSLFSFRVLRTHANSVESLSPFGFALLVSIIAGVSPSFVNWCAVIYLLARLAFWAVYYSGIGKVAGGPRTMCFVVGLISNVFLAGASILYLF